MKKLMQKKPGTVFVKMVNQRLKRPLIKYGKGIRKKDLVLARKFLNSPKAIERGAAIRYLSEAKDAKCVERLLEIAKTDTPKNRRRAVIAVASLDNVELTRPLIKYLKDSDVNVASAASLGIKQLIGLDKKRMTQILFLHGLRHKNSLIAKQVESIWREMKLPEISKK